VFEVEAVARYRDLLARTGWLEVLAVLAKAGFKP